MSDSVATKADLHILRSDLRYDLTMRGIAGLVIAGSILFGALHLWPAHFPLTVLGAVLAAIVARGPELLHAFGVD